VPSVDEQLSDSIGVDYDQIQYESGDDLGTISDLSTLQTQYLHNFAMSAKIAKQPRVARG
jgi:hypothetical protein